MRTEKHHTIHTPQRYMLKKIKKVNIYYCVILKGSYKLEIGRIFFTNRCVYTTDNELFASFIHKGMYRHVNIYRD